MVRGNDAKKTRFHYWELLSYLQSGAHKGSIFLEPENYLFVLRKIRRVCTEFSVCMIAFCLMPNHYHFLIRQDGETRAGILPQSVFNSYSKAYNKRYNHSGTLFEGPYRVVQADKTSQLIHLCRYIHSNPVKDDLVNDLADWPYSNYPEFIGSRAGNLVDRNFILEFFPDPSEYKAFVLEYLISLNPPENYYEG